MKLKHTFHVRQIAGEYVLVPMGGSALAFSGMISTNEVGATICRALAQDTDYDSILKAIMDEFSVEEATAREDLDEFLALLEKANILER